MNITYKKPKRLYVDSLSRRKKVVRAFWQLVWALFFVSAPGPFLLGWRLFLLRIFGAKLGTGCKIEASCRIWSPRNLRMGDYACLAREVDCYNVAPISIGDYATVSQRSFLCSASHDTDTLVRPLVFAPITIKSHAWVCAEAYVGPGITIGEGTVLGARAVAIRDLAAWGIYAGNPARRLKDRVIEK